ncbi:MAG: DUF4920 domain-containing protein [Planctomycetota bacterium]|jgi:hypothetical protein
MRLVIPILCLVLGCGQPTPEATSTTLTGTVYGEGVQIEETLPISAVLARSEELEGKRVRVEGLVTGVCAKRGCWFQMESDKEFESLQFKVTDGVIVFPMSMTGKYAVAEGMVQRLPLDLETTRRYLAHKAEDRGEKFDPATVTEPATIVRLAGTGAVVRDKK